jgi:HK97 gp10 family phage protein
MPGGSVTMRVEGLRELERSLVEMDKAAPRIIAQALRDPMRQVLVDMKTLVPKRTGELADALDLTPVRRASARRASMADTLSEVGIRIKKTVAGKVGTWGGADGGRLNPRYYWHLVEFGTAHSAAHPYIRPAFDQNTQNLIGGFKSIARQQIESTAARYARQSARRKR